MLVYSDYIYFFIFCFLQNFYTFLYFVFQLVAVKNKDILNDAASHFKLARSVLKIASFEFANLQCFNSTFMNLKIVRLVLNVKCEIVVHAVFTSVIVLTVINKIQFTLVLIFICLQAMKYLILRKHTFKNIDRFFLVPDGRASL